MSISDPARVTATPEAREAVLRLRAELGGPVMFMQSGGCCEGSTPLCLRDGELLVGGRDVLLGTIEGSPFYIDDRLDTAWGHPSFVLDVAPGPAEGFSIDLEGRLHFVTRPADGGTGG